MKAIACLSVFLVSLGAYGVLDHDPPAGAGLRPLAEAGNGNEPSPTGGFCSFEAPPPQLVQKKTEGKSKTVEDILKALQSTKDRVVRGPNWTHANIAKRYGMKVDSLVQSFNHALQENLLNAVHYGNVFSEKDAGAVAGKCNQTYPRPSVISGGGTDWQLWNRIACAIRETHKSAKAKIAAASKEDQEYACQRYHTAFRAVMKQLNVGVPFEVGGIFLSGTADDGSDFQHTLNRLTINIDGRPLVYAIDVGWDGDENPVPLYPVTQETIDFHDFFAYNQTSDFAIPGTSALDRREHFTGH